MTKIIQRKETNMAKKKVTDLQAFVETHSGKNFWIGMDVH